MLSSSDARVRLLVDEYRARGHQAAPWWPPASFHVRHQTRLPPPSHFDLQEDEAVQVAHRSMRVDALVALLEDLYCNGGVTVEASHMESASASAFLHGKFEEKKLWSVDVALREKAMRVVAQAEAFDCWLQEPSRKLLKQYSLQGLTGLLPAFWAALQAAQRTGVQAVVSSLTHRCRMQVLLSLGVAAEEVCRKFQGLAEFDEARFPFASGDLLYNFAFDGRIQTPSAGSLRVVVPHNPCHLELVNPVCEGWTRALQDDGESAMCILIHGDGAVSGQGVVAETLTLSQLEHFGTGGTLHFVLTNQVAVHTGPAELRSSQYPSDVAKSVGAPVLHVNADDLDALCWAASVAVEFRSLFKRDIVIEIVGYRKLGHNEMRSENPMYAHPLEYKLIAGPHYAEQGLFARILRQRPDLELVSREYRAVLERAWASAAKWAPQLGTLSPVPLMASAQDAMVPTGVEVATLEEVLSRYAATPSDFVVHGDIKAFLVQRRKQACGEVPIDFCSAEALALSTLAKQGFKVRLSGQDARRGVCIERHWQLVDQNTGRCYTPLGSEEGSAGSVALVNSPLSESAVLAFEFGMCWADPAMRLNIWEAQLGDYFNGAQSVIDGFISACREKWLRPSPMTLLLPHGYLGAGPEHTSCRPERFLQMSSEPLHEPEVPHDVNWHVVNCTTAAQYFHVLRRQMVRAVRKPLIIMGPKSKIQNEPLAHSAFSAFAPETKFQPVLDDAVVPPGRRARVVFVSGTIYYALYHARVRARDDRTAIIRIEELAPFPWQALREIVRDCVSASTFVWCQEEPENGGAYQFVRPRLASLLPSGRHLLYAGRSAAAAPATGVYARHAREQAQVSEAVFPSSKL